MQDDLGVMGLLLFFSLFSGEGDHLSLRTPRSRCLGGWLERCARREGVRGGLSYQGPLIGRSFLPSPRRPSLMSPPPLSLSFFLYILSSFPRGHYSRTLFHPSFLSLWIGYEMGANEYTRSQVGFPLSLSSSLSISGNLSLSLERERETGCILERDTE